MSGISGISGGGTPYFASITNTLATQSAAQQSGNPFANLDLSASQQQQIAQILQNAQTQGINPQQVRSQIDAVLTPAQRQQLEREMHGRYPHHHHLQQSASTGSNGDTDEFGIPTNVGPPRTNTIGNIATNFSLQSQLQNPNQ